MFGEERCSQQHLSRGAMFGVSSETKIHKVDEFFGEDSLGERREVAVEDGLGHVDAVGALAEGIGASSTLHHHQAKTPYIRLI